MGIDASVLRTNNYDGSNYDTDTPVLGDRAVVVYWLRYCVVVGMDSVSNLSHWDVDVREEGQNWRSDPLGEASVDSGNRN